MDSLEHAPHPYPPGRLSPGKSNNNSVEHLGGGKRDSAYSSFSTSSGTPDYTLSNSNTASTENMLYKVSQWDSVGSRHSNGRHTGGEGVRQDERPGYLQLPLGSGGVDVPRTEEQPGSRHSSSSRTNFGPVWHVPDKRKTSAPSPPPPPPPTRSDSFAVTKVHEKGMVIAYPEGPGTHALLKSQGKGLDYQGNERALEARCSYNPSKNSDIVGPFISGEGYNQPQLNPNKTYSFSSTDVRVGLPPPYSHTPYHQRQYSDESTFHAQARAVSSSRSQNVSGYYSSMQELPTNNHSQFYTQGQGKTPSNSLSTNAIDQNTEGGGHSRYYCVTSRQPPQSVSQASVKNRDDRKAGSSPEMAQGAGERNSVSAQGVSKNKYPPSQVLQYNLNNRDSNGQCKPGESQYSAVINPANALEVSKVTLNLEHRSSQRRNSGPVSEPYYMSYPPSKQSEQRRISGPPPSKEPSQEPWQPQGPSQSKICPQKTPMLHSLAKANSEQDDGVASSGTEGSKEVIEIVNGKQVRRNDRFATTLRNEIQMKRAQLQKSRSAATLSSTEEAEEMPDNSPTSGDGSFKTSYKDHLKEAQARVLKATSFRRRDLEPVLLEHPEPQLPGLNSRKEGASLPSVSEVPQTKPGPTGSQVSRIGGRKRIPADKKVRSFSEPDKIHEVGVDEDPCPPDSAVPLVDRPKFFGATGKPAFPKPLPKQPQQHASDDRRVTRPAGGEMPQPGQTKDVTERNASGTTESSSKDAKGGLSSAQGMENQRLGTFAEYEATWNIQRKPPESKPSGRYHSADNILDPAVEERSKPACVHERSRSSPSADFYGQVSLRFIYLVH